MSTKHILLAVFAGLLFVLVVQAVVIPYGDDVVAAAKDQFVREQNLDAQNNIKVHEQGVANVSVQNTSDNTVVTREATDHQSWSWSDSLNINAGDHWIYADAPFNIPADKHLVIEFVSMNAAVPDPLVPRVSLYIGNPLETPTWTTYLPVTTQLQDLFRYYQLNQQVKFYCEPGATLSVSGMMAGNDVNGGLITIEMRGYLTDEL